MMPRPNRRWPPATLLTRRWAQMSSAGARPAAGEILSEVLDRALHGEGGHPAEPAQGAVQHRFAKLLDQREVPLAIDVRDDAIHQLDATCRADAARGALA